jgi:hypothetical protein
MRGLGTLASASVFMRVFLLSFLHLRALLGLVGRLGAVIFMISMFMLTMLSSVEEEDLLSLSIHNYKEVVSIKAYVEFISHDGLNKLNLLHWWNGKMLKSQQQR